MVGPVLATTSFRSWLAIRYNFCVRTLDGTDCVYSVANEMRACLAAANRIFIADKNGKSRNDGLYGFASE